MKSITRKLNKPHIIGPQVKSMGIKLAKKQRQNDLLLYKDVLTLYVAIG